ncbi:bcl-2 homologous antagonist/killer [Ascaphus truei]|uniref:bcl-2 homologous antagonist/killer n=1 Tax=Ascaphus truei TaxID=8439 RepID=UPI003F59E3B7
MASGGNGETTEEEAELQVDEEQVREQTEDVFLSYTYHLSHLERVESENPGPLNPEIEEARQEPGSTLDRVGHQLAIIGDDINRRYEDEFNNILRTLNPNLENAYDYFKKIASSLCETGMNWGRVLTLLGFGYRMAVYVFQKGHRGFLRKIAKCLAKFVLESSIARWIVGNGGWVNTLKLSNDSFTYVALAMAAALILQFMLRRFS